MCQVQATSFLLALAAQQAGVLTFGERRSMDKGLEIHVYYVRIL